MSDHESTPESKAGSDYTPPERHLVGGITPPTTPLNTPVTELRADLPGIHEETRPKNIEELISPSILHQTPPAALTEEGKDAPPHPLETPHEPAAQ